MPTGGSEQPDCGHAEAGRLPGRSMRQRKYTAEYEQGSSIGDRERLSKTGAQLEYIPVRP